jgi:hypothetical protein
VEYDPSVVPGPEAKLGVATHGAQQPSAPPHLPSSATNAGVAAGAQVHPGHRLVPSLAAQALNSPPSCLFDRHSECRFRLFVGGKSLHYLFVFARGHAVELRVMRVGILDHVQLTFDKRFGHPYFRVQGRDDE